ncbi:MAG: hypothetical protein MJ090_00315 [Clostridia bacterium]|nr:hypothetical protein [Clostridia bacterium]
MINLNPAGIFEEYRKGINFKNKIGEKGLYDQSDINERFFRGDQWYGANCGNKRPLVRHNVIKRIGEYKLSQILDFSPELKYSVDGISKPNNFNTATSLKKRMSGFKYLGTPGNDELNALSEALDKYALVTAKRVNLQNICAKALKNAYISGTGIIYTYWDSDLPTGINVKSLPVKGDIKCEVLSVKNVYFGNPYEQETQNQPYIIIASIRDKDDVLEEAKKYGADKYTLNNIGSSDRKILVITKLFKEKDELGNETVYCTKVTEKAVIRPKFNTKLRKYPLAVFRFEERNNLIYGDSEITYLIPNQIAINRMVTANVWSAVSMGMPMMVVNGDTVTTDITNDPGQIIKVFGTNEDINGAIKYITPPDTTSDFGNAVNMLIDNTLSQAGANEVALGDSRADNMSALSIMRNAAILPLNLAKNRYFNFIEEIALIWADFWMTQYGKRKIKICDESGTWYFLFDANRYKDLCFICSAETYNKPQFSANEGISLLTSLLEKGIITKKEYFERLPEGLIKDTEKLITEETPKGEP